MQPKKITPQELIDRADRYKEMMETEAWKTFEATLKNLYNAWGMNLEMMNKAKETRDERLDKIDRLLWKRSTISDVMEIPDLAIKQGYEAQKKLDRDKGKKKKAVK